MTDYTELKPLLEACRAENCDGPREFRKAVEALFDVCTVETISALIAENEHLAMCARQWEEAAMQWAAERDQLKAENEALLAAAQALRDEWRKDQADAERYRWLRVKQTFIWLIQDWFPRNNLITDVDAEIDAAIGKGEQS